MHCFWITIHLFLLTEEVFLMFIKTVFFILIVNSEFLSPMLFLGASEGIFSHCSRWVLSLNDVEINVT